MSDLTDLEEIRLPLPPGWLRSVIAQQAHESEENRGHPIYRNVDIGTESDEHPYILEATSTALSLPLPAGWGAREAALSDGSTDIFYFNNAAGISMWDPPLLRQCLADILSRKGFHQEALFILPDDDSVSPRIEAMSVSQREQREKSTVSDAYKLFMLKKQAEVEAGAEAAAAAARTPSQPQPQPQSQARTQAGDANANTQRMQLPKDKKGTGNYKSREDLDEGGRNSRAQNSKKAPAAESSSGGSSGEEDDEATGGQHQSRSAPPDPRLQISSKKAAHKDKSKGKDKSKDKLLQFKQAVDIFGNILPVPVPAAPPTANPPANAPHSVKFREPEEHEGDYEDVLMSSSAGRERNEANSDDDDDSAGDVSHMASQFGLASQSLSNSQTRLPAGPEEFDPEFSAAGQVQGQGQGQGQSVESANTQKQAAKLTYQQTVTSQWEQYRHANKVVDQWDLPIAKDHAISKSRPPKTAVGVNILVQDAKEVNERIHELLIKVRALSCASDGIACRVMNHEEAVVTAAAAAAPPVQVKVQAQGGSRADKGSISGSSRSGSSRSSSSSRSSNSSPSSANTSNSSINASAATAGSEERETEDSESLPLAPTVERVEDLALLASTLLTTLRKRPELIISAMTMCNPTSHGMSQIAFTMLHRILHPLSTDQHTTTHCLLHALNFQINELQRLQQMFPELQARKLVAAALYINDPNVAMNWNPLGQPLPVVPAITSETVLTCLLRTYGVRRDVTTFFRATWKPVITSISMVIESNAVDGTRTFHNLVQCATRLLNTTFTNTVMTSFPPTATAVCRGIFEIGGNDALHTYLFNLLILPNLLKVLLGDHESVENEQTLRLDSMGAFSQRYYNIDQWWPAMGFDQVPFDSLNTFIWIVWKLYVGAALMNQPDIEILEADAFFAGHPVELNIQAMSSKKLRITLLRTQRRIDYACQCLLRMPLDSSGCSFLGVDAQASLADVKGFSSGSGSGIPQKALDVRMDSLLPKPNAMLSLAVIGRHELANIFSDVGICIESKGTAAAASSGEKEEEEEGESAHTDDASTFETISKFLLLNDKFGEEVGEELLVIPFFPQVEEASPAAGRAGAGAGVRAGLGYGESKAGSGGPPYTERQEELEAYQYSYEVDLSIQERYAQLLHGISLASRYEAALLHAASVLSSKHSISILDLIDETADNNKAWYEAAEIDVEFCRDSTNNLMHKHTQSSEPKVNEKSQGLSQIRNTQVHATSLPHGVLSRTASQAGLHKETGKKDIYRIDRGDHISHKSYVDSFKDSLRFNTHERRANVGTSIMGPRPQKPLADPHGALANKALQQIGVRSIGAGGGRDDASSAGDSTYDATSLNNGSTYERSSLTVGRNNSRYTKPVVKDERFLKQTASEIRRRMLQNGELSDVHGPNRHELLKGFLGSLRQGYYAPKGKDRGGGDASEIRHQEGEVELTGQSKDRSRASGPGAAQQFPEHLRNRIRQSGDNQQPGQRASQAAAGGGEDDGSDIAAHVNDLLQEYSEIFGGDGDGEGGGEASRRNISVDSNEDEEDEEEEDRRNGRQAPTASGSRDNRGSNANGEMGAAAGAAGAAAAARSRVRFEDTLADMADEDLPEALPEDFVDQDLKEAWQFMSPREKRQSIHFLFPKGAAGRADRWLSEEGQKFEDHAHVAESSQNFSKATKSRLMHIEAKSRQSIFNADGALGGFMGLRDSVHHADSLRHSAVDKAAKRKTPFRPGGVGGLDRTLAMQRKLAARLNDSTKPASGAPVSILGVNANRSPPRGSFWGANPQLSRSRLQKLFHPLGAGAEAGAGANQDEAKQSQPQLADKRMQQQSAPAYLRRPASSDSEAGSSEEGNSGLRLPTEDSSDEEDGDYAAAGEYPTAGQSTRSQPEPRTQPRQQYTGNSPQSPPPPPPSNPKASNAGSTPGPGVEGRGRRYSTGYMPGLYSQSNIRSYSPGATASAAGAAAAAATSNSAAGTSAGLHDINHVAPAHKGGFGPASGPISATAVPKRGRHGSVFVRPMQGADSGDDNEPTSQSNMRANQHQQSPNAHAGASASAGAGADGSTKTKRVNFAEDASSTTSSSSSSDKHKSRHGSGTGAGGSENSNTDSADSPSPQKDESAEKAHEEEQEASAPKQEIPKTTSATDWEDGPKSSLHANRRIKPEVIPKASKVVGSDLSAEELIAVLIAGADVTKHGRKGKPKLKHISMSDEQDLLVWVEHTSQRFFGGIVSGLFGGATGKDAGSVRVDAISEVRKGIQTEVLQAAGLLDPLLCLSIVTSDRTVDIAFNTTRERDLWLKALKAFFLKQNPKVKFIN